MKKKRKSDPSLSAVREEWRTVDVQKILLWKGSYVIHLYTSATETTGEKDWGEKEHLTFS